MPEIQEQSLRIIIATRQQLLLAMGIVIGIAALIFAVMIPQGREAWAEYQQIEQERPRLESYQNKVVQLDNIPFTPEYAQIEIIEEALPSRNPLLELLVSLNSVSADTDVVVVSYDLSPGLVATDSTQLQQSSRSTGYDSLQLNLSVQGTFNELQDFLRRVEEVAPFSTITSLQLSNQITSETGAALDAQDQEFSAELITETYYFTRPITVTYESPLPVITDQDRTVLNALASFVPTELPVQNQIQGGGLEDLFQLRENQDQLNPFE
ncbi:MAG: GspMb/PilO family protein [Patescibacteria group bacterium]